MGTSAPIENASFIKRLAGPSTGKAGLAQDQTAINNIIAEASRGSKYYEVASLIALKPVHSAENRSLPEQNERKKDEDVTERITKILKHRDEILREVDLSKVERSLEHVLFEIEAERDLTQIIVHMDMDAFYANVELLHNPDLRGKPFAVGHGVLTTASYEARKYGVRSGMAGFIAKKLCPDLIFVPNHFSRYQEKSNLVMSILKTYDPNMLVAGCDEGYLNITDYCDTNNLSAEDCVRQMRQAVFEATELTASAGIASNKMLAKICSDRNKPNGQFYLAPGKEAIIAFMKDLPIRKVPGIGRVSERLLDSIGIKTCGDVYTHRALISLLDKHFGFHFLLTVSLGIASNVVQPYAREERKSIGAERTFSPLSDKDKILAKLDEVAVELEKDMTECRWTGRTVTLKYKLNTFQVFTRSKSFDHYVTTKDQLFTVGKELLEPEFPLTIRLIGLRLTKLKDLKTPEPTVGIKRFFESRGSMSPKKTRRTEDGKEDVMPGQQPDSEMDLISPTRGSKVKPSVAHRDAADVSPTKRRDIPKQSKVKDASKGSTSMEVADEPKPNDCPLCGKTIMSDNDGLNAHIDFCLSRDAIRQAQVEASASAKRRAFKHKRQ